MSWPSARRALARAAMARVKEGCNASARAESSIGRSIGAASGAASRGMPGQSCILPYAGHAKGSAQTFWGPWSRPGGGPAGTQADCLAVSKAASDAVFQAVAQAVVLALSHPYPIRLPGQAPHPGSWLLGERPGGARGKGLSPRRNGLPVGLRLARGCPPGLSPGGMAGSGRLGHGTLAGTESPERSTAFQPRHRKRDPRPGLAPGKLPPLPPLKPAPETRPSRRVLRAWPSSVRPAAAAPWPSAASRWWSVVVTPWRG